MKVVQPPRHRGVQGSRSATLEAAEELFAAQGFHATSLQEICDRAGVSRGLPGYLFGSKLGLYRAVLDRFHAGPMELIQRARGAAQGRSDGTVALKGAIDAYFDFLLRHPNFIRLMEWEALYGGDVVSGQEGLLSSLREALGVMCEGFGFGRLSDAEAGQFLISIVALIWFPLAHARTFVSPLGFDPDDPTFLAQRRRHVIELILNTLSARSNRTSS